MSEAIDHPKHYISASGLEAIDVIEGWGLNFNVGNVAKYILRAGKKGDQLEDLKKARWYLDREIKRIEKAQTTCKPDDDYADPIRTAWGTVQP